ITVGVVEEERVESNASFVISRKRAPTATIGDGQAAGTIFDDDAGRQVVIDDATVLEGDSGTTNLVFTLTLSKAALTPVTVSYVRTEERRVGTEDYTTTSGSASYVEGTT